MSLFGGTNTKPTTGLFGSTQPSQPSGGIFGNTNTNANQQPGTFGTLTLQQPQQPQPQQQQQQQQQQQPAGGLFGAGQTQGGGLFGSGGAGGGAFGNSGTGTGSSIFGNTGANVGTNTAAASTGGGLFGNTNTNTTAGGGNAGGGLFGNTNNTAGASNFFAQPPAGNTSSAFGQQQPPQQQPQQQQQGSLFGSLGQTQSNQPPSFGLFGLGQTQPSTNPSTGSGLFGSNPLTVSALSQPAPTSSLFGPKPAPQSTSSFLPTSHPNPSDNSAQAQFAALQQRIEAVVTAWNPQSSQCRFQHYFYNLVDPRQVSMYGRPPNATNDALWRQAVRENPDPSCMVPALAVGFDDLHRRVNAQSKQAALHQEKLKEVQARLAALAQTHLLANTLRTTRALQTHTLITHRLLRLLEHIHLLIPSLRSAAIGPEEEALRAKLERLRDDVQRGVGGGGGRGRVNELWALLGAVQAAREGAGRDSVEWKVVDQDGLERLAMILSEQQQGLAHLTSIINNDMKDLQIIEGGGIGEGGTVGNNSPHRGLGASVSKSGFGML